MPVEVERVQGEVSAKVDFENVTENKQEIVVSANKEDVGNGISNGGNGHGNDKEDSYVFITKSDTAGNDSVESDPYSHKACDIVEHVDTNVEKDLKEGENINSVKLKMDARKTSDDVLGVAQVSQVTATSERGGVDDGPEEVGGIPKSENEDPSEKRPEQQHPANGHQEIEREGNLESTEEVEQLQDSELGPSGFPNNNAGESMVSQEKPEGPIGSDSKIDVEVHQGVRIEGQEKSDLIEKLSEDLQHNEVLAKHPVESDEGKESEVVSSEVSPNDSNDGGMGLEESAQTDSAYTINGSESVDDPTGSEPVAVLESVSLENGYPPIESEPEKIGDVRFTSDTEKVNASDGNGDVLLDSGTVGVAVSDVSSDVQAETQTLPVGSLDSHSSDKACAVENGESKSEPEAIQDLGSAENSKVQPEAGGGDVSVSDGSMITSIESQDVSEPADQDGKQHIAPEATAGLECHEDAGAQVESKAADSPASEERTDAVDCTKDSVSEAAISDGLSCTNQQESENGERNLNNGGDVCLNSAEEAKDSPTGDLSGNVSLESSETLSTNINGEGEAGEMNAVAIQFGAFQSVNTSSEAHVALPSIEDGEINGEVKDGFKVTKTNVDDVCEDIPPVEVSETGESDIKERILINDAEEAKSDNNSENSPLVDSDSVIPDEQQNSREEKSETSGATVSLATEAKTSGQDLESEVVTSTDTMHTGTKNVASEDAPDCVDSQLTESNGGIKLIENENETKNCSSPVEDEKAGVESTSELTCSDDAADKTNDEVASEIGEIQKDLAPAIEGSVVDASEGQTIAAEMEKKPFYFLPRVPRYEDEKLSEQLKHAEAQVEQKTQSRDAIRVEIQTIRATNKDYEISLKAAVTEERSAKKAMHSKRQEIEALQSVIGRIKNAASVDDIDAKLHGMEHKMQHETISLNEEKGYIREIKNLKQRREQITSSMGTKDEIKQALDEKEKTEERLKVLKKELDVLRHDLSKVEAVTKAAQKKSDEKWEIQNKLQEQFRAADAVRQEAFVHLQELKKQQREKNKYFFKYRDDSRAANEMALKKDRASLQHFCSDKVENFMDLWNNDDEFRKYYVRCNTRSTLRRFGTLDGRSLGPDEEPPRIPYPSSGRIDKFRASSDKAEKHETVPPVPAQEKVVKYEGTKAEDSKTITKPAEQKNQTTKSKKIVKSDQPTPISEETVSEIEKSETAEEQPPKLTKEEEELIKKEEEKRKQKEAAKIKEQHRLEEIAKAKDAMERKKKREEKAKARAALKAQKEAEEREKEREKKLRKKERRKGITTEDTTIPTPEIAIPASESPKEIEIPEKQTGEENQQMKKSHKPSQFLKQNKSKSIPPPLRNRGSKRKLRQWLWIGLVILVIVALFLLGNANLSFSPENLWFI